MAYFSYSMVKIDKEIRQKGLNLAIQLSGWLVVPLVAALFFGDWLDQKYGTAPRYFWILVGLAFAITMIGLIVETVKYKKELDNDLNINKLETDDASQADK